MNLVLTIWMVAVAVIFIGIVIWVWNDRNKEKYERAARIPLEETENENSNHDNDGDVNYVRGLHINRVLDRDRAARRDGLHATLQFDMHTPRAAIILTGNTHFTPPDSITVSFLNATRQGYDHVQEFKRGPDGVCRSAPPALIRGHWYIQIEKQDWRLLQTLIVH